MGGISILLLVLSYFIPTWTVIFYLVLPVSSFFFNRDGRAEIRNITLLSDQNQDKFLRLSGSAKHDFQSNFQQIKRRYIRERRTNPNWQADMQQALAQLFEDVNEK